MDNFIDIFANRNHGNWSSLFRAVSHQNVASHFWVTV